MINRTTSIIGLFLIIVLAVMILVACGSSTSTPASSSGSTADGQTLLQQRCSVCHSLDRVTSAKKKAAQWKITVDRMINNGAQVSSAEEQTLVTYLAKTYHQ
jgi:mono/diheme cytochrome c family protein